MSLFHLIWIIPVSAMCGVFAICIAQSAGRTSRLQEQEELEKLFNETSKEDETSKELEKQKFSYEEECLLNYAIRYACGRKTEVVDIVCNYINDNISNFSTDALNKFSYSILLQKEENSYGTGDENPLGDECNVIQWENLYSKIQNELGSRNELF